MPAAGLTTGVPKGYNLFREWDLTKNEGWDLRTIKTISAAIYRPENVLFTPGGIDVQCKEEDYKGYRFTSGELIWNDQPLPLYWYVRYVAWLGQKFDVGDFPAFLWFRGRDGVSEIDGHESMGGHLNDPRNRPADRKYMKHKTTMIKTPYGAGQVNYSAAIDYTKVNDDAIQGCTKKHTYELYKNPGHVYGYVDGVLMTHHYRDSGKMSKADWDAQFEKRGRSYDMRISYQYGDDPDGKPVGSAGPPQDFGPAVKHMYVSSLIAGVPS